MPRLLYTYLANQVLAPFYASLVILTSILFLGKLVPILDIILDYNISFSDFIRLYAYFTPQLLLFALPMSSNLEFGVGSLPKGRPPIFVGWAFISQTLVAFALRGDIKTKSG